MKSLALLLTLLCFSSFNICSANAAEATSNPAPAVVPPPECVTTASGKVCGYHCLTVANKTQCAGSYDQSCVSLPSGEIACGYNCIQTKTSVACANRQRDNCVANNAGTIICGNNCNINGAFMSCDKTE